MKCPKCGKDVEIQKRPVGTDDEGNPILNEFAICRDCKKKWNLDKQRQKKSAETAKPKAAVSDSSDSRPGNIPPEHVRKKQEAAVKKSYEEMLNTDPGKAKPRKKRPMDDPDIRTTAKSTPGNAPAPKPAKPKKATPKPVPVPDLPEEDDDMPIARFKILRLILAILSIIGGAYFAYCSVNAGLDNITSGGRVNTSLTYGILAGCLIVSGFVTLLMRNLVTRLAFFIPMILSAGGAVFAFLKKEDDKMLLYGFIAAAVLAVVYLVLTLLGGEKFDDEDGDFDEDEDY